MHRLALRGDALLGVVFSSDAVSPGINRFAMEDQQLPDCQETRPRCPVRVQSEDEKPHIGRLWAESRPPQFDKHRVEPFEA